MQSEELYLARKTEISDSLSTVIEMLRLSGQNDEAEVLGSAEIEIEETGYDNWNGGTSLWIIYLRIPPVRYLVIEPRLNQIQTTIAENLTTVLGSDVGFWVSAEIRPQRVARSATETGNIQQSTRTAILDEMRVRKTAWSGGLDEVSFLSRLFNLEELPSTDRRFGDAAGDIWQHCVNNEDWGLDWVFSDHRFQLATGPQDVFLEFLCEVLHPVVRSDHDEQIQLARAFNTHLSVDGWELVEECRIGDRPRYVVRRSGQIEGSAIDRIKAVAASLNSGALYRDLQRLENAKDADPALAIGMAKDIVEGCCRLILDDRGVAYSDKDEIPKLVKTLQREIKIMPNDIPEDAKAAAEIRTVVRSLGAIAHSLGAIRNEYGTGHGRGRKFKGLEARHARLAIGAAAVFVDFMYSRHVSRQPDSPNGSENV